jgi:hypothetical protein
MIDFSVLDWNAQNNLNYTGFTRLKKIKDQLLKKDFDILILQEIESNKLQDSAFQKYETAGIIFPAINNKTLLRNCLKADIKINDQILRIYNCHFAIVLVSITTRLKQLEYILADAKTHNGPTIICGDMNVTIPKAGFNRTIIKYWHLEPKKEMCVNGTYYKGDERELFNKKLVEHGFKEALNLYTPTWSPFKTKKWEMFKLKLDWFATKNLIVTNTTLGDYISDHRSIEKNCQII